MPGLLVVLLLYQGAVSEAKDPLLCYQCNKTDPAPCGDQFLLPCPPSKDRCVTHLLKDKEQGFRIRRECGLAPCKFSDEPTARSLGMDRCDTSRDHFFCVTCCEENGCNRDGSSALQASLVLTASLVLSASLALLAR